jgi:hypothetical protein
VGWPFANGVFTPLFTATKTGIFKAEFVNIEIKKRE